MQSAPIPPLLQVQSPVIGQAPREPLVPAYEEASDDDSSDGYLPPPIPTAIQ